jgi:hypothetical protein
MNIFNQSKWEIKIQNPFWYCEADEVIKKMNELRLEDKNEFNRTKDRIYSFFEASLKAGKVALGATGNNWDSERKPIDTIVIHHTSNPKGLSNERLSAIGLIRLYALAYAKRKIKEPIFSGHWREGKQVFYPYHWMIRSNGIAERLLFDNEIGWHAGNWDINCKSIAICIDDDHEFSVPDRKELQVIARIIQKDYPNVSKQRIFGHREINPKTTCPSESFLSTKDTRGWKKDLLDLIN